MPIPSLSATQADYAARMNRVLDHIQAHLGDPLELEDLARVACFSPFHFHRLFRAWMGETLFQCIQRLRLERAAFQVVHNPRKPLTEVALDLGFASSATFARAFRAFHGCSAGEMRKLGKVQRKAGKAETGLERGSSEGADRAPLFREDAPMNATFPLTVQVQDLPPMTVAYLRHIGPYKGDGALFGRLFGQLCNWAGPRGLLGAGSTFLSLYYDMPDLTEEAKLRMDVAVTVPEGTPVEGPIGRMRLEGGLTAMARINILPHQYEEAWNALMTEWLPQSGYQPDDRVCMEIYRNDPGTDPQGRHILDLCLPVKPASLS